MQSSFKIIKEPSVVSQGSKTIITQYIPIRSMPVKDDSDNSDKIDSQDNSQANEQHELAARLVEDAKRQSEVIVNEASKKAQAIEKDAYEKASKAGYSDGQQQGYADAYEQVLPKAEQQAASLVEEGMRALNSAKIEYENYMAEKKEDILNLAINIARQILKREVERIDGMDDMLIEAIKESRNAQSIIIRVNSLYVENVKAKICDWKERFALRADIFVVPDELINKGNAILEKNNGKIELSIDDALENIRNSIQ